MCRDQNIIGTDRHSSCSQFGLEVVGIDSRLMNNGTTLYLPLATFQALLGRSDTNAYWVVSADQHESGAAVGKATYEAA